jgi:exodeoxyribonuclease VII large subunit
VDRLPFDPAKMIRPTAGGAAPARPASPAPASADAATGPSSDSAAGSGPAVAPAISVSALAALIDGALKDRIVSGIRVIGQVSNFTHRTHWYFAIKDSQSVLNCVMFAGRIRSVGFQLAEGQEVVVTGRVEYYAPRGQVSFYVERIEPVGVGALELRYRALVQEVRALGWFDADRKRPLPAFPARIVVITSRTGAALADVRDTMRRRCPAVDLLLIDTLVQGPDAAPHVARAINWASANARALGIDAIIVTRGGGSMEDLWAFNEKIVAQAIVDASVPVVAAIGHETDTTIAELVADERCATPTQAAMRLTPDRAALSEQVRMTSERLASLISRSHALLAERLRATARAMNAAALRSLGVSGRRLATLGASLERARPSAVYERRRSALRGFSLRLSVAMGQVLEMRRRRLEDARLDLRRLTGDSIALRRQRRVDLARQLELVGPAGVLRRGFSVTLASDGTVLRSIHAASPGQVLTTRLADGDLRSTVQSDGQTARPLTPSPRPARKRPPGESTAPGLFG